MTFVFLFCNNYLEVINMKTDTNLMTDIQTSSL